MVLNLIKNMVENYQAEGYVVGGYVRDRLLGRPTNDIDIIVDKDVFAIAQSIAVQLKGCYVELDQTNQVARVILHRTPNPLQLDISRMKGADIQTDLKERDFTINALALPLATLDTPLDLVRGRRDLNNKSISLVKPDAFVKDPLRILRGFRLAAELSFTIAPQTISAMAAAVDRLPAVSGERIWAELVKLFTCPDSGRYVYLAHQAVNLWANIIPQVQVMQNTKQNYHHQHNVWEHSMQTLLCLEKLLSTPPWPVGIDFTLKEHLNSQLAGERTRLVVLKLACLMHDVGKTITATTRPDGRITFYGHARQGVKFAADLADRLHLSNGEKNMLMLLVEKHMHPLNLYNEPKVTDTTIYRFFKNLHNSLYDCLLLSLADVTSTYQSTEQSKAQHQYQQYINHLLHLAINEQQKYLHPVKLVTGSDLIQQLDLKPSPIIGWLLQKITEGQVEGTVTTQAQALSLARRLLRSEK